MKTTVKEMLESPGYGTLRILPNVEIWKEVEYDGTDFYADRGGRFNLMFINTGAIIQFDYDGAPKYMKNIVDSSMKSAATQIKNRWGE